MTKAIQASESMQARLQGLKNTHNPISGMINNS